ncbi:hypothetical protein SV7mr_19340 [Stieleria bergensis]|uniref:Uncharacterized protein n=1 Tax=Stieleria bergensis TaxID=2528025 RepID=A0A517STH4_9BACT|nr:hypothetical protein SV7mr_19340 [Planctomycetes bacterium SV_7m_r]
MTTSTQSAKQMKAVVSLAEMCRMLGMSRSHFYWHLKRSNFHQPLKLASNGRPYFTAEMAQQNMDVKETGINVQGDFVIFYERRPESEKRQVESKTRPRKPTPQPTPDSPLAAGLQSLGMTVNSDQIESALIACFPNGTDEEDEANVLRTVFRHLKRAEIA